jgi:outer membrane lipoprotein-sorting protein
VLDKKDVIMKKLFFVLSAVLLLGACGGKSGKSGGEELSVNDLSKAEAKRYPFRSGVVKSTLETMGIETFVTTYIDDWGDWEVIETVTPMEMMGQNLTSRSVEIIKGDDHWKFDPDKKTGTHYSQKRAMSSLGVDVEEVTEEFLGKMNMEKLGEENYLGYNCKKFKIKSDKGTEMVYLMYGNLMMKMDGEAMGIKTSQKVTSVEEGSVPPEKFDLPEGITITEEI